MKTRSTAASISVLFLAQSALSAQEDATRTGDLKLKLIATVPTNTGPVIGAALSPNGRYLVTAGARDLARWRLGSKPDAGAATPTDRVLIRSELTQWTAGGTAVIAAHPNLPVAAVSYKGLRRDGGAGIIAVNFKTGEQSVLFDRPTRAMVYDVTGSLFALVYGSDGASEVAAFARGAAEPQLIRLGKDAGADCIFARPGTPEVILTQRGAQPRSWILEPAGDRMTVRELENTVVGFDERGQPITWNEGRAHYGAESVSIGTNPTSISPRGVAIARLWKKGTTDRALFAIGRDAPPSPALRDANSIRSIVGLSAHGQFLTHVSSGSVVGLASGDRESLYISGQRAAATSLRFAVDGESLIARGLGGASILSAEGKLLRNLGCRSDATPAPGGGWLLLDAQRVRHWDPATRRIKLIHQLPDSLRVGFHTDKAPARSAAIQALGRERLIVFAHGQLRQEPQIVEPNGELYSLAGHSNPNELSVCVDSITDDDGRQIALLRSNRYWHPKRYARLHAARIEFFNANGRSVAVANMDRPDDPLDLCGFSPDGKRLLVRRASGTLQWIECGSGEFTTLEHRCTAPCLRLFDADSIIGCGDGSIFLMSLANGERRVLAKNSAAPTALALSPDRSRLAIATVPGVQIYAIGGG